MGKWGIGRLKDVSLELLKNPLMVIPELGGSFLINRIPDRTYLEICYKVRLGKRLNLENPQSFNEKLQWLKLNDRNPIYTNMVDKYEVRRHIADKIGEEYLIPLIGVWEKPEEIDFKLLPDQFVLKCTHDSGGVVICRNRDTFNARRAMSFLNKRLRKNYYWSGREWPYKNIKPRVIAEKYMADESGKELKDYKVFNFNGVPRYIQVDYDRFTTHKRNVYDTDWNLLDLEIKYPSDKRKIKKPAVLDKMLELSADLSEGIPFLRTDFYLINGRVYFGELTFYHGSGTEEFRPGEWDYKFGQSLDIGRKA